jgi:hypothetical protein
VRTSLHFQSRLPPRIGCSVEVDDHLAGPHADDQFAGHTVALPELLGPVRAHVAAGDLGGGTHQLVRVLRRSVDAEQVRGLLGKARRRRP